tara:strand:- start:1171 stop:2082 length:912 start_codon:yes stop_codon:yes gene_type:complete
MDLPEGNIQFRTAPDGTVLRIGHWPPHAPDAAKRVFLCHGRTEFLEKYAEVIGELLGRGYEIWSMDWRGQGLSGGKPANPQKGHIGNFSIYLDDLAWLMELAGGNGPAGTFLMGHSMGGHIVLRALLEKRLTADGAILTAPMIDLPMRRASRTAIAALCRIACLTGFDERYIVGLGDYDAARVRFDGNPLTGDAERFAAIHAAIAANPGVEMGGPTFGWLNAAFASIARLRHLSASQQPTCPILIFTAAADTVVSVAAQDDACNDLPTCTQIRMEGARHEILHETDEIRRRFWSAFDNFTEPF